MMWVKFVRAREGYAVGDVARFDDKAAQSLIRHGVACLAPDDLIPRLRQPVIETAMRGEAPEMAVTRRAKG